MYIKAKNKEAKRDKKIYNNKKHSRPPHNDYGKTTATDNQCEESTQEGGVKIRTREKLLMTQFFSLPMPVNYTK